MKKLSLRLSISIGLFAVLCFLVTTTPSSADLGVRDFFYRLRLSGLNDWIIGITHTASPLFIVIATVLNGLVLLKRKNIGGLVTLLMATVGASALNKIIKGIMIRERPNHFPLVTELSYSFPSGHSMIAMAFYPTLLFLFFEKQYPRFVKWAYAYAFLIALTRLYLGVHWMTDILGGCILGYAIHHISIRYGPSLGEGLQKKFS